MRFVEDVVIGANVQDKDQIMQLLRADKKVYRIYLICLLEQGTNLFEIILSTQIDHPTIQTKDYLVVGIADNLQEAQNIVKEIITSEFVGKNIKQDLLKKFGG